MILKKENNNVKNFNNFTDKLPYLGKEGKILLEETIDIKEPFNIFIEANIIDAFYTKSTHSIHSNYNRLTEDNSQLIPLQMWGRKSIITQDGNRVEIYPEKLNSIRFSRMIASSHKDYERYYDLEYQMGYFSKMSIVTESELNKRIIHRIYYSMDGIKTFSIALDMNEFPSLMEIPESDLTRVFDLLNELKSKGIKLDMEESMFKSLEEALEHTKDIDRRVLSQKQKKLK